MLKPSIGSGNTTAQAALRALHHQQNNKPPQNRHTNIFRDHHPFSHPTLKWRHPPPKPPSFNNLVYQRSPKPVNLKNLKNKRVTRFLKQPSQPSSLVPHLYEPSHLPLPLCADPQPGTGRCWQQLGIHTGYKPSTTFSLTLSGVSRPTMASALLPPRASSSPRGTGPAAAPRHLLTRTGGILGSEREEKHNREKWGRISARKSS